MSFEGLGHEELIKKLASGDAGTRNAAIMAMADSGDDHYLPYLEKLSGASDPAIRYFAKKAIKKIRDGATVGSAAPESAPEEMFDLENFRIWMLNPSTERRLQALRNVSENPPRTILPVIAERIAVERDPHVIATLVKLLGKVGGPEHINTIRKFLAHEDLRVRANAIEGLELIGSEKIIPFVAPFLNDGDNRIRANAAKALAKFQSAQVMNMLAAMSRSEHPWMRDSAIYALLHMATDEACDMLGKLAYDGDKNISSRAVQALLKIGTPLALKLVDDYKTSRKDDTIQIPKAARSNPADDSGHRPQAKPAQPASKPAPAAEKPAEPAAQQQPQQRTAESAPAKAAQDHQPQPATQVPQAQPASKQAQPARPEPAKQALPSAASPKTAQQEPSREANDGDALSDAERLKAQVKKKESEGIAIYKDQEAMISSNFKDSDDDFYSSVPEIKFLCLSPAAEPERKKPQPQAEKPQELEPADTAMLPRQKTGGTTDAKLSAEMKKKIVMDQLKGLGGSPGKRK